MTKLPALEMKHKVCVICEGYEDVAYFNRLLELETVSKRIIDQVMQAKYEYNQGKQTTESGKRACQNA